MTADTKVILINSDDSGDQVGVPGNALSADYEADEIGDSGYYYNNAKYILDGAPGDDVDVKIVVVDVVNNKMADVAQPVAVETANPSATDVNNALTAAGSNGTVVVTGTLPASGVSHIGAGQTLVLTSAQTTSSLEALKANAGATLVIQKESTGNNVTADKWFHGTDGSAAAYSGQKVLLQLISIALMLMGAVMLVGCAPTNKVNLKRKPPRNPRGFSNIMQKRWSQQQLS